MRAAVIGFGAVGRRVARALAGDDRFESVTVVHRDPSRVAETVAAWPGPVQVRRGVPGDPVAADVTVVSVPAAARRSVTAALDHGSHVICPLDDPVDVRMLLDLDPRARSRRRSLVLGTAMAPGLSCVLAARMRGFFDRVDEVHVASLGTGGPVCARRHHAALAGISVDWVDGAWRRRAGGSGRELVWFPEPVGGADCYRAALADPVLLQPAFPGCRRITARLEATRRDRLTSWLPMLRPPHPEGLVGAVRVEMRGWLDDRAETRILGVACPPAVAAAAVSAEAARWAVTDRLARTGAGGMAEMVGDPGAFLKELAVAGVTVSAFQGSLG
ncbi:MAG TPA: Gfo/Idh/MocA family oxidoreductase [Acidimicrobiales bacterium]|nr:Gfo/Idh/MocA family oxidoreductase [Acidimicrobiales bacterium]